jgi:hypothetical protein
MYFCLLRIPKFGAEKKYDMQIDFGVSRSY